jgi:predicted metal-dependent phosphoesterase TrpH
LKVDFHSHTLYSPDSITLISVIIKAARKRGLDRLVITDHNSIEGALEAYKLAPDLIIVGEEVQTTQGEFLTAFITNPLPKHLEPEEALKRLKDQGAFISVSHPFDPRRSGWSLKTLEWLAPQVDAIEVHNGRVFKPDYNRQALEFAQKHLLPGNAGSDGHHPSEIGRCYSELPDFHDAESLRVAVQSAQSRGYPSSPLVHLYSFWARMKKSADKAAEAQAD